MRRIVLTVLSTLSALVLLFSYHTSLNRSTSVSSAASAPLQPGSSSGGTGSGSAASGGSASSGNTGAASGSSATRYTGGAADTRWGVVQVQITVQGGRIVSSQAIRYPDGNGRDQEINSFALPVLNQEVVTAQNAQIDTVSGATVTSDGYIQSLQSAIDAAHL